MAHRVRKYDSHEPIHYNCEKIAMKKRRLPQLAASAAYGRAQKRILNKSKSDKSIGSKGANCDFVASR